MEDIAKRYLKNLQDGDDTEWVNTYIPRSDFHKAFRKALKGTKLKKYIYMVTFTLNPTIHPDVDDTLELEVADYIEKQAIRSALKITRFEYVKEHHKSGRPHWHALIETNKPLKKDRFNYYCKKYGAIDIAKNKAQQNTEILNYISKVETPKKII